MHPRRTAALGEIQVIDAGRLHVDQNLAGTRLQIPSGLGDQPLGAGGFARAAERLALSRSAVGKTIARLEARLGVRLFHRTTSRLSLTEDGQIYYERCLRALEALLESGRREVSGRLKITMPLLFGRYCAEPILLELAEEHPALELDLRFSDSVVDLIGERFDLAIRNHTAGESKGLSHRKIASQNKVVCASPAYLARRGTPIRSRTTVRPRRPGLLAQ